MADDQVQYEFKTVRTVRGTEALLRAKWEKDGWEFVDQDTATLRTTLNFRRAKPPLPWLKIVLGVLGAVILLTIIGVGALMESDDKPVPNASPSPTASRPSAPSRPAPTPVANITNITVDGLLDKMNNTSTAKLSGQRFRFTGELFESDAWGTGASGDFSVMLKAKGGADDLPVFVKESAASEWTDGTKVEMVVKVVKATIDGETTDGWLRAESAKTISGGISNDEAKADNKDQRLFLELSAYAEELNRRTGTTVIDSIQHGAAAGFIYVNLNAGLASDGPFELKANIKELNRQIVDRAEQLKASTPMLKYFLAGDVVAENRYIMDPWDVKFEGLLDD